MVPAAVLWIDQRIVSLSESRIDPVCEVWPKKDVPRVSQTAGRGRHPCAQRWTTASTLVQYRRRYLHRGAHGSYGAAPQPRLLLSARVSSDTGPLKICHTRSSISWPLICGDLSMRTEQSSRTWGDNQWPLRRDSPSLV